MAHRPATPALWNVHTDSTCRHLLLGGIALAQAIPPIATHFSVAWSVVCHIRAPCLNRSADLHAIWQEHLWGPVTHCVRWGLGPQGKGRVGDRVPRKTCCNCFQITKKRWFIIHYVAASISNSAFYRVTLVVVCLRVRSPYMTDKQTHKDGRMDKFLALSGITANTFFWKMTQS